MPINITIFINIYLVMTELDLSGLETLVDTFVREYRNALQKADKVATGQLLNSIDGDVVIDGTKLTVSISAEEQWKYVEYGRKPGTYPNLDAILRWIKIKGLPRSNRSINTGYKGKLPSEKQLAFLISRKIKRDGIPSGNYVENTLNKTNFYGKVELEIANMISKRFMETVKEEINEITARI